MITDLIDALGRVEVVGLDPDLSGSLEISSIDYDSRRVGPGSLFCCLPGLVADGHDFAEDAVRHGAVALLSERRLALSVPELVVADARSAMGTAAAALHGWPSEDLAVVGITGTNGKTTVAHLVVQLAEGLGLEAAAIGTLTGERTTPESPDLQERLASLRSAGKEVVAMEVSSHALELRRVVGTRFRVAAFTNLSPEHLDFHGDMEDYFEAKARLFSPDLTDAAVINVDDSYGLRLARSADVPVVEVSLADVDQVEVGMTASTFVWRGIPVRLPLGGAFNVLNAVMAGEVLRALGHSPDAVGPAFARIGQVPGRFERIDLGQPFEVIVDYAHTPDGLIQLLDTVGNATAAGRVLAVFGCGGDRDRSKRPLMGQAVAGRTDASWLTSDNPRDEDPEQIIAEVLSGMGDTETVTVMTDRREAITAAVGTASPGDVVVIAGKGHETEQLVGADSFPFDDRVVAREAITALDGPGSPGGTAP